MNSWTRRNSGGIIAGLGALAAGWWLFLSPPAGPTIKVLAVEVVPTDLPSGTHLNVTTKYENTGCSRILLARFLINTQPVPSFALPQQQGPTVLPASQNELVEEIDLNFPLGAGHWHLFTNVVCYNNGDPVPAAVVSPTALFDQN